MQYKTFTDSSHDATLEPMFLGKSVNVARYDKQKYATFEKLIEKQLSFFWRPEEVDLTQDSKDFHSLPEHEQHIFTSNLQYQTLLDSVQGRAPNLAFLPAVSLPELETWIETWSFSETIHSRSYTHILRNIFTHPSAVFDQIVLTPEILERAVTVTRHYDHLIALLSARQVLGVGPAVKGVDGTFDTTDKSIMKALYMALVSVNVLEAIRFYVSFACSFAFAERSLMEGNAKIIKLIARDEALHLTGTQHMINYIRTGKEGTEWQAVAQSCEQEVLQLFIDAAAQEKAWAEYLFKDGSMLGLNASILGQYVEYLTDQRLKAVGLPQQFGITQNPLPWINNWLVTDNVQVAPQETEISSYLVGQIDPSVSTDSFGDFTL